MKNKINYKFNEHNYIEELHNYIDATEGIKA